MSTKLDFFMRPMVAFEPSNKEHRKWFAEFHRLGTWSRCPVRFAIPEDQGDLVTLAQRKLIDHYLNKEFGEFAA